jgi:hypothetical protein
LLRFDAIWTGRYKTVDGVDVIWFNPQLYAQCAQIKVESEFDGDLPKGILIPEDLLVTKPGKSQIQYYLYKSISFSKESPGMHESDDQSMQLSVDEDYVYPGGPLWDGENLVQDKPLLK